MYVDTSIRTSMMQYQWIFNVENIYFDRQKPGSYIESIRFHPVAFPLASFHCHRLFMCVVCLSVYGANKMTLDFGEFCPLATTTSASR